MLEKVDSNAFNQRNSEKINNNSNGNFRGRNVNDETGSSNPINWIFSKILGMLSWVLSTFFPRAAAANQEPASQPSREAPPEQQTPSVPSRETTPEPQTPPASPREATPEPQTPPRSPRETTPEPQTPPASSREATPEPQVRSFETSSNVSSSEEVSFFEEGAPIFFEPLQFRPLSLAKGINTCYINSAIQALQPVKDLLGGKIPAEINRIYENGGDSEGILASVLQANYAKNTEQKDVVPYLDFLLTEMGLSRAEFSRHVQLGANGNIDMEVSLEDELSSEGGNGHVFRADWSKLTSEGKLCIQGHQVLENYAFKKGSEPELLAVACDIETEEYRETKRVRHVEKPKPLNKKEIKARNKALKRARKKSGKKGGINQPGPTITFVETSVAKVRKKTRPFDPSNKAYEQIQVPLKDSNEFATYQLESMIIHNGEVKASHYTTYLPKEKLHLNDGEIENRPLPLDDARVFIYRKV